jgi:hypothetical protein
VPAAILMNQRQLVAINNPCARASDTVQLRFARRAGNFTTILTVNK